MRSANDREFERRGEALEVFGREHRMTAPGICGDERNDTSSAFPRTRPMSPRHKANLPSSVCPTVDDYGNSACAPQPTVAPSS